jgi:predicted nucleotidyltransferase
MTRYLRPRHSTATSHQFLPLKPMKKEALSTGTKLENIIRIVKSLEGRIRTEYRAEIIGVFGSYARGEQKRGSDVDVLVRFLEGATLFDLVGLGDFLEERLKVKVDIVSERAVREELRERILGEVVTI